MFTSSTTILTKMAACQSWPAVTITDRFDIDTVNCTMLFFYATIWNKLLLDYDYESVDPHFGVEITIFYREPSLRITCFKRQSKRKTNGNIHRWCLRQPLISSKLARYILETFPKRQYVLNQYNFPKIYYKIG